MRPTNTIIPLAIAVTLLVSACASTQNSSAQPTDPEINQPTAAETEGANQTSEKEAPPRGIQTPTARIPTPTEAESEEEYRIVTLLPRDAIRSIDDPQFLDADEADEEYAPDEEVLGVVFEGEARAYSVPLLSSHEIVNDTVGGHAIAVTW